MGVRRVVRRTLQPIGEMYPQPIPIRRGGHDFGDVQA